MIHLYTGDGKGKTTAAIGQAVRAAGNGITVCFAQFMKGRETGELNSLERLPQVTILRSEKDFGFYSAMSKSDKEQLTAIHNSILDYLLRAVRTQEPLVCVLDEITYPVNWNLLDTDQLKALLEQGKAAEEERRGRLLEIVMTGRSPADFLQEYADYITEMKALRHPYEKGVGARRGIEY